MTQKKKQSRFSKLFKRWRRWRFFRTSIRKWQYPQFLSEVDKAIQQVILDFPDTNQFIDKMGTESVRWLNDMSKIHIASFKVGVCYGIFTYAKLTEKKKEKESYVV